MEWSRLLPNSNGIQFSNARKIDTNLALPLRDLRDEAGQPLSQPIEGQLAVRNLLRGYRLGLPTGQAIAQAIGVAPLCGDALLRSLPAVQQAVVADEGFSVRTPLWFYVLAEAGDKQLSGLDGSRLGAVGSRIVAEALYNMIRFADDSILPSDGTRSWSKFSLRDLLSLAGVA